MIGQCYVWELLSQEVIGNCNIVGTSGSHWKIAWRSWGLNQGLPIYEWQPFKGCLEKPGVEPGPSYVLVGVIQGLSIETRVWTWDLPIYEWQPYKGCLEKPGVDPRTFLSADLSSTTELLPPRTLRGCESCRHSTSSHPFTNITIVYARLPPPRTLGQSLLAC